MAEKKKCANKNGCDGFTTEKSCTEIRFDCTCYVPVYPCNKCGALHSPDGDLIKLSVLILAFWDGKKVVDKDNEPIHH